MLAVSTGLRVLADRWRFPYATLLVLGGLALAAIPNVPRVRLRPDLLFLVFVPPLLYWAAALFPLRDFRRSSGPILRLAILLVVISTVAVAVVVRAIDPIFTWAAAFTLGAIVSPPDPVAVLSVMRSTPMPREIERILEGEGLLNDASALVLYRLGVAAAVTGVFSPWRAAGDFFVVALGGAAIGFVFGVVVTRLRRLTQTIDVTDATVSLLTPFGVYLTAEALDCSGVIAVVVTAMYVARRSPALLRPSSRVQIRSMWSVTTFLLESLAFILVGIEIPLVIQDLSSSAIEPLIREVLVIFACLVVVRVAWVFPSTAVGRRFDRWLRHSHEPLPGWRSVAFVGWAGVRGGDSLVIALALPMATAAGRPFPARDRIIFITFGVILTSLVIQSPTLRPLARALGLHSDSRADDEEAHARLVSAEAALRALDKVGKEHVPYPEVVRYLRQRSRQRARRWAAQEARGPGLSPDEGEHGHVVSSPPSHQGGTLDELRAAEYGRLRAAMIAEERRALVQLRDEGTIGDDVMATLERELDFEQIVLEGTQPVVEPPREIDVARP